MKRNNIINDWLDQYGDPKIEKFISKNLAIVEKVRISLKSKGWNKSQLAKAIGKNPSEITKWLSGMHNLTLKSIIKMEDALGIDLIHCEPIKEYKYVSLGVLKNNEEIPSKDENYTSTDSRNYFSVPYNPIGNKLESSALFKNNEESKLKTEDFMVADVESDYSKAM